MSIPAKLIVAGNTSNLLNFVLIIASSIGHLSVKTSYTLLSMSPLQIPIPVVALPCGSKSTKSTFLPNTARDAERFILVVVFPTPPFD